jgi:hypothetical protein
MEIEWHSINAPINWPSPGYSVRGLPDFSLLSNQGTSQSYLLRSDVKI